VLNLVTKGTKLALLSDGHLLNGLNVHHGMITHEAVAREFNYEYIAGKDALANA
jgi:alanine dehydrogenase